MPGHSRDAEDAPFSQGRDGQTVADVPHGLHRGVRVGAGPVHRQHRLCFPAARLPFRGPGQLSWVLIGYAIVFAALLVPAGRLADQYGRKRGFVLGLSLFTLASAACAAAPSPALLIAARVLQGAGGAILTPSSLGVVLPAFAPRSRPPDRRAAGAGQLALGVPGQPAAGAAVHLVRGSSARRIPQPRRAWPARPGRHPRPDARNRRADPRPHSPPWVNLQRAVHAYPLSSAVKLGIV
jgi:Major Facilitator Superfamily